MPLTIGSSWLDRSATATFLGAAADGPVDPGFDRCTRDHARVDVELENRLRDRIKSMPADRFEQLVYAVAHREDDRVERVERPDGGADTILPRGEGLAERVWQAKHYPKQINWSHCEKSLVDAMARWKPSRVTFVFPRDLSEKPRATFDKRLVETPKASGAAVDHWNLSHLVEQLAQHRDLAYRYWPELESQTDKIDRVIKAGGKLESGRDIVDRAKALAEFADRDPDFRSAVTAGGLDTEAPNFDTLPYMMLEVRGAKTRVHVATWIRDGAKVERPTVAFSPGEDGQVARMAAVETLARGEAATVTGGFSVAIVAPEILKELTNDAKLGRGNFDLLPGDPLTIRLELDDEGTTLIYTVALRPVPSPPGANAAWAGYISEALLEMTFTLLAKPAIRVSVGLRGSIEGTSSQRAQILTLLHAFHGHEAIRISSDVLFPGGNGVIAGKFEHFGDDADLGRLGLMRDFFTDLALIEEELGINVTIPDELTVEDYEVTETVAEVLRTGEGSATFEQAELEVENPAAMIPQLVAQLAAPSSAVEPVTYELFGKTIHLGRARYEVPALKMVDCVALGTAPDAPARLRFVPEGDPDVIFRLIDRLPADSGREKPRRLHSLPLTPDHEVEL
jgi:hypothetical protein